MMGARYVPSFWLETEDNTIATITLSIPDAQAARVADAFAVAYGYQDVIPNPNPLTAALTPTIPNPETRAQHMRRQIMAFVQNTVKGTEVHAAAETARAVELAKAPVNVT